GGIWVWDEAAPTLEGNTCEENQHDGIAYFGNASGTARNNVCRKNGSGGIWVWAEAAPTLEGNTCEENQLGGIAYFDNAGGTARNNVCRKNGEHDFFIADGAKPSLESEQDAIYFLKRLWNLLEHSPIKHVDWVVFLGTLTGLVLAWYLLRFLLRLLPDPETLGYTIGSLARTLFDMIFPSRH
ncbi:MAG: right-handed parallel beta-helix repeat-containing protein, partial [Thermogutta sp.]|uniref:right-handed parallel beta-helix repeat-containing protein n=1 Tax=Thermogutta sp. TaxID=1962930 RepID=UPI0019BC0D0E